MHAQWHRRFLATVLATALGAWASSTFAASEYVVVAVDPPTDVPALGTLYRLGDLVHIDRGSVVTLMGDDGSVTALPGPADILVTDDGAGSGTDAPQQGSSKLGAISDLLSKGGGQVQAIGAARGANDVKQGMETWTVPVKDGMAGCIREGRLELWREPGEKVLVSVGFDGQPLRADLVWEASDPKMVVPESVPVGAKSAAISIGQQTYRLVLNHLPSDVSQQDHVGLYAWLISSGCALQASAFIRELVLKQGNP